VFVTQTISSIRLTSARDLRGLQLELGLMACAFDPDAVHLADVPGLFVEIDAVERWAASIKTLIARRMDDAATWKRAGFRSAAEQMAAVAGTSVSGAHRQLTTSKEVAALPATADAMRAGKLSLAKAAAIASAATVAPEAEAELLAGADSPLAVVRKECLKAKGVDRDATHKRLHRDRSARDFGDDEGAWNFMARGTVDAGAEFHSGFDPIVEEMFEKAKAEGRTETRQNLAFDALLEMARRAHAPAADDDGPKSPPPARFLGLLRADIEALQRGWVEGDEVCEIAGMGPIPVWRGRELLGDSILKLVLTKGVDVANVTHLGRSPTMAQKVALMWQSPECIVEGCTRTKWLEYEHRVDWIETKHTKLDESERMCGHDHDLKTHFGWSLVEGTGKRAFVPPDDPRHPKYRAPPDG
jgi:hypothetical protein